MSTRKPLLAAALALALTLTGCVGNLGDELSSSSTDANLAVTVGADGPADADHLGLEIDGVFAHDANVSFPDGYQEINVTKSHADLVDAGTAGSVELASGSVPAGTYDQLLVRLSDATVESSAKGNSSGGHDHGGDGHQHSHSDSNSTSESSKSTSSTGALDVPINVTFEVTEDERTTVELVLDTEKSVTDDGFSPTFAKVAVKQDGETVTTEEDVSVDTDAETSPASNSDTKPPAARMTIFAPNGNEVFTPKFDAKDGQFVNSKSDPYKPGDTLRFSGTESDAVARGAQIAEYSWDFDDGTTTTGATVQHSFDKLGVFEVELTVTDSNGVTDTHMVRVIVLQSEWTTTLVEQSFESGAENWKASSSGSSATPAGEVQTTWQLDGQGHNSSTAWHVGHHETHQAEELLAPAQGTPGCVADTACADLYSQFFAVTPGYTSNAEATLTSPTFTVPADWSSAGVAFHVGGATESGFDPLTVTYTVGGESGGQIAQIDAPGQWVEIKDDKALAEATGEEVQFQFTFTSDGNTQEGPGFYVDNFRIGGVDLPIQNAHLLEDKGGGHGGHDHSH